MDISSLFDQGSSIGYLTVYEDDMFSRKTVTLNLSGYIRLDVIKDFHIIERVSLYSICISFESDKPETIHLEFGRDYELLDSDEFTMLAKKENLFCIPVLPTSKSYDRNGHIICDSEQELKVRCDCSDDILALTVSGIFQECIELQVVSFHRDIDRYLNELTAFCFHEKRHVKTYGFFDYSSLEHTWNHLTMGTIYHVDYTKKQPIRWECQQCANSLYGYLRYLYYNTSKELYAVLCREIAYSVMLSLPEDSRWRHGHWTNEMETHTRHQVDGIDLLISAYDDYGKEIFLQKAKKAMDFLISIAESLEDHNIWFMHDTCEFDQDLPSLKKIFRDFFVSTAFGKSHTNTLCLNTHIWTLAVSRRLNQYCQDSGYSKANESAESALRTILDHKEGTFIYSTVYLLRDLLIGLYAKTRRHTFYKLTRRYTEFMKKKLLPFLKKRYPRLLMPNGFLERDLSAVHVSDIYFLVNIQDMLLLYSQSPLPWLRTLIERLADYIHKSRYIYYMSRYDERISLYTNITLMCLMWFDFNKYAPRFLDSIQYLQPKNYPLCADIFGHWAMARHQCQFNSNNPNILNFSLNTKDEHLMVIVNPTEAPQALQVEFTDMNQKSHDIVIQTLLSGEISLEQLDSIQAGDCIMIRLK